MRFDMIIQANKPVKQLLVLFLLAAFVFSLASCRAQRTELDDIYATDAQKEQWREALVKLISNQAVPYGENDALTDYKPPRPDEPSISEGWSMGLFDITRDGVPELFVNLGSGSAGNDYFYVYDIFSGQMLCQLNGGGDEAWGTYYDIPNGTYVPIGRYDWRTGYFGSMHYITTVEYDKKSKAYDERTLFHAAFEHNNVAKYDENGEIIDLELKIEYAIFEVGDQSVYFQDYHYKVTEFYQTHSLVPHTGLKLYRWEDVANEQDDAYERAEKMAEMLLFGSGQQFVRQN